MASYSRRSARLVRLFEKNLNLTIIGSTITLKIQGVNDTMFSPTKVGVVAGPEIIMTMMKMQCSTIMDSIAMYI